MSVLVCVQMAAEGCAYVCGRGVRGGSILSKVCCTSLNVKMNLVLPALSGSLTHSSVIKHMVSLTPV